MESQGHGATPLTVTRGGSFAKHRFVHQLTEPMAMAMEEHPQEPPQEPMTLAMAMEQHPHHHQAMTMAPNGATAEAKRGPLPSGKA